MARRSDRRIRTPAISASTDEAENQTNIRKHGIGFETAKRIFEGPVATSPDHRRDYGEDRNISIGRVEPGALIVVAHTERNEPYPSDLCPPRIAQGGAGSWVARGAGGDHAQGLASFAEGGQRAGSAQLRRGRVQRAARDRPGDRRGVANQRAQGGPGQEAVCGGRSGSGAWGPAGSSSEIPSQGGRGFEARLVALSCGDPPEGRSQWSLRLLADRAVELGYIDSVSHETVRRVLRRTPSNRGGASAG